MFRNRNSQKPNEEFYAAFKQNFPGVGPTTSSAGDGSAVRSTSLSDALTDAQIPQRQFGDEEGKEHDVTPKGLHDHWRFTPSLMDPNSFAFATFANQPPGYYTPTPGGVNTLYHSQAGDLHTPGMGMSVGTPLSLPHTAHALNTQDHSLADLHHFQSPYMQMQPFHGLHPYTQAQQQQQQTFHPSSFLQHQDSGYEAVDHTPPEKSPHDADFMHQQAQVSSRLPHGSTSAPLPQIGEKFRYHVTLNAPTAMIKHADEIPITYLNKGQAYSLSVIDTRPPFLAVANARYRTYVRVSFEDEQQRSKPAACWQLWKEGRGTNEAHQRGGKLLAVEYVDPNPGGDDSNRRTQVELDTASFDGFWVTWSPNPVTGGSDCVVSVRFNFLSTDFSHSKGVKGIPVRLCAKTELLESEAGPGSNSAEVCYCKVKLFRDHGAERKLSNDVAHVKKTIDKLKQQIAQAESGMGGFGKRKRSSSAIKTAVSRPGKVVKHKRTWSIDSDGDMPRPSAEEDLHIKLATMQDMFSSTRPVSVLYLKGEEGDDPDAFPVQLGDLSEVAPLLRTQTWESKASPESTSVASNVISPTPSSRSHISVTKAENLPSSQPASATKQVTHEWPPPEKTTKLQKRNSTGDATGWIEAAGIDDGYIPPLERNVKPVACFYAALQASSTGSSTLHRAVYLAQRTTKNLIDGISSKLGLDISHVTLVTRVNSKGIKIVVDDDVVRELPEGQAMLVDVQHIPGTVKEEIGHLSASDFLVDGELDTIDDTEDSLELRLIF